ncbi:putative tRNA-splicing endonuclease subunit sen-2 [Podospora australis]|uniref:tRNA-intron lyase n=1 Tax=Podospora australis TaxID=1536484 RepID=A0AAN7AE37_9PEZI|nr:putative tRNA-splicing endonuclease subunit sen-2 [Podospora australis]
MATVKSGESLAAERTVGAGGGAQSTSIVGPPRVPLNQIYALPAPIRTFPLPSFYPNNPISLLHLVYAWLKQVLSPPPAEPSVVYVGIWDPDTRSVHVVDPASIRALWEQGFYGKGSLSRSEPNWMKRELARRGSPEGKTVSEVRTEARREERRLAKWERAKTELEAVERQRLAEAAVQSSAVQQDASQSEVNSHLEEAQSTVTTKEDPVTPPIDVADIAPAPAIADIQHPSKEVPRQPGPPVGPAELLALPNSLADLVSKLSLSKTVPDGVSLSTPPNGHVAETGEASALPDNGEKGHPDPLDRSKPIFLPHGLPSPCFTPSKRSAGTPSAEADDEEIQPSKRQKSVRFSPRIESTVFQPAEPPSPSLTEESLPQPSPASKPDQLAVKHTEVEDKEHFQLSPEEAFFLVFALGALKVVDRETGTPIRTERLLSLFRSHSYFPPSASLRPNDPFLVNYAVYHHFRSLGWVPRHGIKFGVDWILYQRGPVFDHSEFGIMVMPSFSRWEEKPHDAPKRTWSWLMGVNRVLSHVLKSLVLVYVDIPPPLEFDDAMQEGGIAAALKKYRIREIMVRRWSSNRNR